MQFLEYGKGGWREGSAGLSPDFGIFFLYLKKQISNFPVFNFYYCFIALYSSDVAKKKILTCIKGSLLRTMSHACQFENGSIKSNIIFLTMAVSQVIGVAFN